MNSKYEIIIYWSEKDGCYISEVPELAGCMADGATYASALENAQIIIDAFVVVVIGGMGSVMGALVASLLVGVINAYGVLAFPGWSVVMTFVCMAVVLIVRPWGLFGSPE
jgi:branched-chain amino acid transport system permease protein